MLLTAARLSRSAGLLANQTAIITGAGQGIGAECAKLFASEGAKVAVCDMDGSKADVITRSINGVYPGHAVSIPGDVTDASYIPRMFQNATELGKGEIHLLVNNAGFTWDGAIHKISDKQWEAMLAVHSTATFRILREAAPYFRVRDGNQRAIVNVSSTSGTHGNFGQANYAAAKASVIGLTKTVAKEWGPRFGVRANTVAFGRIDTRLTRAKDNGEIIVTGDGETVALGIPNTGDSDGAKFDDIPLRRPGTPVEAAGSILAVCSPLFGYVSGQTIEVTGGRNI